MGFSRSAQRERIHPASVHALSCSLFERTETNWRGTITGDEHFVPLLVLLPARRIPPFGAGRRGRRLPLRSRVPLPLLFLRTGEILPTPALSDIPGRNCSDYETGQLYGLEKFWAFLKYNKHGRKLTVDPKLKEYLANFKTIEDFRVVQPPEQRRSQPIGNRKRSESESMGDQRRVPRTALQQQKLTKRYGSGRINHATEQAAPVVKPTAPKNRTRSQSFTDNTVS